MFRDKETDLLKGEMYHIIKPDDHLHGTNGNTPRNRMSIVDDNKLNSITNGKISNFFPTVTRPSDLYLARLITSKQIIQPYVDDFFNTLLLEKTGQPVPPPIKYLFDFLDQDALHSLNKNQTLTTVKF